MHDCICIVTYTFFNYIWITNFNPLFVCWKKSFLAPYHVVRMFTCSAHFIFLILFKYTQDIVVFTDSRNMSIFKQVYYCLPCISYLTLEACVLILYSLYLIATICDAKLMLFLYFFYTFFDEPFH